MILKLRRYFTSASFIMGLLGGGIFLIVLYVSLARVPDAEYRYRDDGIITLSHAKNLVDFGHIGVDPSGKRVEGYSAPVQFWIYTVAYGLTGIHWQAFCTLQTFCCTFLLGFLFIQFFQKRFLAGLIGTFLGAFFLSFHYRFLEWHASGMENAWTHLLFLAAVYVGWRMLEKGEVRWWWIIWPTLATLSRLDSIVHVAPVVALFALAFWIHHRSWKGLWFAAAVASGWALYQFWRVWYFGDWTPHTGIAQGIDIRANIGRILAKDSDYLAGQSRWVRELFYVHGGLYLLLLLPGLLFAERRERWFWPLLVFLSFAATTLLNPYIFGLTRLDPARSTTFLTVFLALTLALVLTHIPWNRRSLLLLPLLIVFAVTENILSPIFFQPKAHLCCAVDDYWDKDQFADRYREENGLHRLNFANPDLGKLSYLKEYNITDLGFLGSPLMAGLRDDDHLMRTYFFDFIRPDVVEVHGEWVLRYARLLSDARFQEIYVPLTATREDYMETYGQEWPELYEGVFVRKDLMKGSDSPERALILALKADPDIALIQRAFNEAVTSDDPRAHQWVVRTAYRFLPELRETSGTGAIADIFRSSPSAEYDRAVLMSARVADWEEKALQKLLELRTAMDAFPLVHWASGPPEILFEKGHHRLYQLPNNDLIWSMVNADSSDLQATFSVHAFIADREKALLKNEWGVDNLDFYWDPAHSVNWNGERLYHVELPHEPLTSLLVGVVKDGNFVWREQIRF